MGKTPAEKAVGIYHLQNVKETASGFKLNPDGTFLFFFTYGALDRYGSGHWAIKDDYILLQSKPWGGKDFALVDSRVMGPNPVTIKMVGSNPVLANHVYFSLRKGETGSWLHTNQAGIAQFPAQPVTNISAVFEFAQERFSHFDIANSDHNYFEFRLEPWIMEVFFEGFILKYSKYALTGKHPLIKGQEYVYEKS
jgi:hypothetical protein